MLLAVDPGVKTMGYVVLNSQIKIVKAGAISLGSDDKRPFHLLVGNLLEWLWDEIQPEPEIEEVTEVACEMPQFFHTRRGHDTAAGGDLTEMSYCVGRVAGFADHVLGAKFIPVPVVKWKGQLPKGVVISRLKAKIDTSKLTPKGSHDWDACGIGLFVKGKF
jgi:hypothetical protein